MPSVAAIWRRWRFCEAKYYRLPLTACNVRILLVGRQVNPAALAMPGEGKKGQGAIAPCGWWATPTVLLIVCAVVRLSIVCKSTRLCIAICRRRYKGNLFAKNSFALSCLQLGAKDNFLANSCPPVLHIF